MTDADIPPEVPTPPVSPEDSDPAPAAAPIGWTQVVPEGLSVELEYDAHVNYAMQQNAVPVVKAVRVVNTGTEPMQAVELTLWAAPELARQTVLGPVEIAPGAAHRFAPVDLAFSAPRLVNKEEREQAQLWIEVTVSGSARYRRPHPLEVLAYSEWAGARSLPEILAAFVLPNHPAVETLLAGARDRLAAETGNPSLSGYQTRDPERVRTVLGAIYNAAADLGLSYVNPPASFEVGGQKIRTPDRLVETGLATCLDLTCLLAAAVEQAGYHALLVLLEGHALLGVWLSEDSFAHATVDEVLRLRKRVQLESLLMVETTGLATRPALTFPEAVQRGARQLDEPVKFAYAVDVHAARRERIRPLPGRARREAYVPLEAGGPPATAPEDTAREPGASVPQGAAADISADTESVAAAPRLERWKQKLLDLSLRNRLLNFKPTRSSMPLRCPDIHKLEDLLAAGQAFRVEPRPELMGAADPRDASLHLERTGVDAETAFLLEELGLGRLHADLDAEALQKRLVFVDRAARTSLEEGGANTLYLALGILHWYETETSTKLRRAPILLLPMTMSREGSRKGYRLALADEDPQVNVTLLQKLAVDYDVPIEGLDQLAADTSGVDVAQVLRKMRAAILPLARFEVREEAVLGLFSFTKHLMWRDLDGRAADLMTNRVVRHLVEQPGTPFPDVAAFGDPTQLDRGPVAAEPCCPLDADSSQLLAIHAAAAGHTFVLEGPPGTGKSQTIANLIAHALGQGQRVLFVSEKMAALSVVSRRLQAVGLAPFCLSLHSNKARKRSVLEQLEAALAFLDVASAGDWEQSVGNLTQVRGELADYVDLLHRPRSFGVSAFEGLCRLQENAEAPEVRFDLGATDVVDTAEFAAMEAAVVAMCAALGELSPPHTHPYRASAIVEWTPGLATRVEAEATAVGTSVTALGAAAVALGEVLEVPSAACSAQDVEDLEAIGRLISEGTAIVPALLTATNFEADVARAAAWAEQVAACLAAEAAVATHFAPGVLTLPILEFLPQLRRAGSTFWPLSWWRARKVRAVLKTVVSAGSLAKNAALIVQLQAVEIAQGLRAEVEAGRPFVETCFAQLHPDLEGHATLIPAAIASTRTLRTHALRISRGEPVASAALQAHWLALAGTAGPEGFVPGTAVHDTWHALRTERAAFAQARDAITGTLELDVALAFGLPETGDLAARVAAVAETWHADTRTLRAWAAWRRARAAAVAARVESLAVAVDEGRVDATSLPTAFLRGFHTWWVDALYGAEPVLRGFSRAEQEARVARFRKLDHDVRSLSRDVVRRCLAKRLPRGATALSSASTSELGVVQRELKKQRRHMPIRSLFKRIPNLLPRLKPCMLMSPLSVAQYLAADFPRFDLVVFDEASQIPTWDAVGAIARGNSLVVVGDSKQLPPTTFFLKTEEEDLAHEDDIEELQSILDECLAVSMSSLRLGWHYRSRHESLIAFSNVHYYDGGLFTFPAAAHEAPHLGVSRVDVPGGVYAKGRSRVNELEAQAVVAEVVRRLSDPAESARSLGVVTFSIPQQTRILDLLDQARRAQPGLDRFFQEGPDDEAVFVKNLENVQGDERDVILFSICYGPDDQGRIAMNFGPLNRDGGERRLNVAVTRAREQVMVFSTLRADDIDLARTNAVGVAHLKAFLAYAEFGARALDQAARLPAGTRAPSALSAAIRLGIESGSEAALGIPLEVVPRVGASGYRIDLGVLDPDDASRFLLGVETDGPMYATGPTVRDRDRTRHGVLTSLGWQLDRIWATDWWQEPDKQLQRVFERVRVLRAPPKEPEDAGSEGAASGEAPAGRPEPAQGGVDPAGDGSAHLAERAADTEPALPPGASAYIAWQPGGRRGTAARFHLPASTERVEAHVRELLDVEAPVALDVVVRVVAERWSIERVTERVTERVVLALRAVPHRWIDAGVETFLWRTDQEPGEHVGYRVPASADLEPRAPEHVPLEEIANAALAVLTGHVAMPALDLARETGRLLGYSRLGSTVQRCMEAGVEALVSSGRVRRTEGQITLPSA